MPPTPTTIRCASAASRSARPSGCCASTARPPRWAHGLSTCCLRWPSAASGWSASRSCSTSSGRASWSRSTTSPRRSAACASCSARDVIATVPGRGYRFTAPPEGAGATRRRGTSGGAGRTGAVQTRLPHQLTPLLGRDDDLAALAALLQRYRLVTVVGAGGIGKTLLAQHLLAARRGATRTASAGSSWPASPTPPRCRRAIAEALGVRSAPATPLPALCAALSALDAAAGARQRRASAGRRRRARGGAARRRAGPAPGRHQPGAAAGRGRTRATASARWPCRRPAPAAQAHGLRRGGAVRRRARGADARFVLTDANAPAVIELCRATRWPAAGDRAGRGARAAARRARARRLDARPAASC